MLIDRIPGARPLTRPLPRFPFPRGLSLWDGSVYPLTMLLFTAAAVRFEDVVVLTCYLWLFGVLLALSVMDMETLRLPDRLVLPATAIGLALIVALSLILDLPAGITSALAGAGTYFGVLFLAHLVHPRGMGFGDVKLSFIMGLFLGWPAGDGLTAVVLVVWAMLIGFGAGSVIGVGVLIVRGRSAPYPFGPFLAAGAVIGMLVADELVPAATAAGFGF